MNKKFFIAPLSVLSIALIFSGCANNETTMDIGKNLDNNLNNLTHIVTKLDTIDNNYMQNPDIKLLSNKLNVQSNDGKVYSLAFAPSTEQVSNNDINNIIKQLLYNKLSERLTQNSNGNCKICNSHYSCDHDGFCNNCGNKIICDSYGNCTNCGKHLQLTQNNTCANCNNTAVISQSSCNNVIHQLSSMNDDEFVAEQLSTNAVINKIKYNNDVVADELHPIMLTTTPTDKNSSYTKELTQNNEIYDKPNIKPRKYNPKHIKDLDSVNISEQIDAYIEKLQKLYTMSSDTIEANTLLAECKQTLLDTIVEVKELNKNVINGKCVPSTQQVQALKNYIADIKTTVKRLKDCNGDLNDQVYKISNSNDGNVTTSVDVLNSNYLSLLNHIDTRITYHESAISTLEQIKYLLEDAIAGNDIDLEKLEEYDNQLFSIDKNENNDLDKNNNSETENMQNIPADEIIDSSNNNNVIDNQNEVNDNTNNTNTDESNIEQTETPADTNNNEQSERLVDDKNENDKQENNIDNEKTTNIDTYKNSNLKNIDTYKNESKNALKNSTDETIINNENISYNDLDNDNSNLTENEDNTNNAGVFDNNTLVNGNNGVVDNADNNFVDSNPILNGNGNYYKNGVIYDNNLITKNNIQNRYYYGDDGKVHNTTNTLNNNFAQNTNHSNMNSGDNLVTDTPSQSTNNVNTYGYSTILDTVNQGTVNNGINTL